MVQIQSKLRDAPLRHVYAATAFLILVLIATNVVVILHLRESELLVEENQLNTLSLTAAEQANRSLQSVDLVITSVAERTATEGVTDSGSFTQKLASRDIHLLLGEKIEGIPQLDAVSLISDQGKLINSSRIWPIPEVNVSDRDYFRALKDDPNLTSYISAPVQNRVTGTWTIFLAHRVNGAKGEFIGLIFGAIEMQYFEDFYQKISLGEGSSIGVQRLDGVLLARFPRTDAIGSAFSGSERLLRNGFSGMLRELSPIDGQMRIKAAHLLTNYPVIVLATKTEKAALRNWWSIARLMSLGAVACVVSIAIAGFALGRHWKQQALLAEAQAEIRHQDDRSAAFDAMTAAKEVAEMSDRTKSEFLATMSHELRTPLNAIIGFSEMMVTEVYGPQGDDHYRGYAQDIHSSGCHLLRIVTDILDLSKAAAGKLMLVEGSIDASAVVHSVCRLIHPQFNEAGLSLNVKSPPNDLTICADERLLKQMLLNLLSNARKFTPRGGRVECALSVDDTGITFSVVDTGVGIAAENLDRVLMPFIQVDSSLSRRHEGTGLGLSLVKAMVELHGGFLRLDSEVGQGTTASVILPASRLKPAESENAPQPKAA